MGRLKESIQRLYLARLKLFYISKEQKVNSIKESVGRRTSHEDGCKIFWDNFLLT